MKQYIKAMVVGLGLGALAVFLMSANDESQFIPSAARGKPVKATFNPDQPTIAADESKSLSVEKVVLGKGNTYVFRSQVDALTTAKAQEALLDMDKKLPGKEPIYLVLDTPGGDIPAGNMLVDTARNLKRPVHTITIFAASMGFNFVQRLGTRYILPSGTLMAHRARVEGVGGQVPGEFITAATRLLTLTSKMESQNADRLGIGLEEYTDLVNAEYWVEGEDAVKQNAADKLVAISCDSSLAGTHDEYLNTFFGKVILVWSNCPAVTNPIDFKFAGAPGNEQELRDSLTNYRNFRRKISQGRGL